MQQEQEAQQHLQTAESVLLIGTAIMTLICLQWAGTAEIQM
jgi:hypothetical protein